MAAATPAAARRLRRFLRHLAPHDIDSGRSPPPLRKSPVWNRGPVELPNGETSRER